MIRADVEQVKQVFFNVIGNAIDVVPEGSEELFLDWTSGISLRR